MSQTLDISNYEICFIKLSKFEISNIYTFWLQRQGLENLSFWQRLNSFSVVNNKKSTFCTDHSAADPSPQSPSLPPESGLTRWRRQFQSKRREDLDSVFQTTRLLIHSFIHSVVQTFILYSRLPGYSFIHSFIKYSRNSSSRKLWKRKTTLNQ